jgi:AcrR family transcriptional regulator
MSGSNHPSRERILHAAIDLFLQQGIRKTSVDDVAERAGVTRVTVYRHFADRQELIAGAFQQVNQVFDDIRRALAMEEGLDGYLDRMAKELTMVPLDFMSGMAELETLHPEIHSDLRERRTRMLRAIFDGLYERAEREGRLRPGLDRDVVDGLFWEIIMTLPQSSVLSSRGIPPGEIYATLSGLLLYGLLKE